MSDRERPERRGRTQHESGPAGVHEAALLLGWLVPTSEQEVLSAERDLAANPVALPESLRDTRAVFDRTAQQALRTRTLIGFPEDPQAGATLARAAREAGRLTPEVEERMRRDRESAEEKKDRDRDGKDVR